MSRGGGGGRGMGEARGHIPKFGNWDSNDRMPYTAVFNQARAGKTKAGNPNDPAESPMYAGRGKITNPNDPAESPSLHVGMGGERDQAKEERAGSNREERERVGNHRSDLSGGNLPEEKAPRTSTGGGSPARDKRRKGSVDDGGAVFAPLTPGRSRLRSGPRVEEPVEKHAALPRFGSWDAKDPSSGDGFTFIFDSLRGEKKSGVPARATNMQAESPYDPVDAYSHKHHSSTPQKPSGARRLLCCFQPTAVES